MSLPTPHPSLVAAFEQAANDVQLANTRASAETTLASLTARPDSIPLMFAVLQTTSSSVARFHAAKALQTATRERWHTLSPHHRYTPSSFRHSLINIVLSNPQLHTFERVAILRTVAFLTRRAYLEEPTDSRDAFFSQLCDFASSPQSPPHTSFTAIHLIDLIIDEFTAVSGSTLHASAINREMYVRARLAFSSPQGHLLALFDAAVRLLQFLTSSVPSQSFSSTSFTSRALPALSVIHRVFTTDFRNAPVVSTLDNSSSFDSNANSFSTDALETVVINTFNKPEWHSLINQISLVLNLSFSILAPLITTAAAAAPNNNTDSDLISNPLHIITAIAAISHASYPTPQSASHTLSAILTGLTEHKWSASPLGPVRLAYAEVWRRVSCAHGLTNLEKLPTNHVISFTADTCQQMDAVVMKAANSDPEDDEFCMDVIDLLLETWANLALQGDDGSSNVEHPLSSSIEQVIMHFMRMSLRTTGDRNAIAVASGASVLPDVEEDLGFDDTSIDDARLSVAAILTRFVLEKIVDALAQSLLQAADNVFHWPRGHPSVNGLPLDLYQEDLYFLIRLTSAVLTDEAKGENPSVPTQFLPFTDSVANGYGKTRMHARMLLTTIFNVVEKESRMLSERGAHCDEASPRVGAALLDCLGRIVRTYLGPLNMTNVAITFEVAGGLSVVETGRTCCFVKAIEGLTQRGFESDIAEAAGHLLLSLATASKTYNELCEAPTWQQLLQAGVEAFQSLPPKAVQDVGKSLTLVLGEVVAERLLIPAYNFLQTFVRSQEQVADAAERVIATLHLVRGVAKSESLGTRTRHTLIACLQTPDGIAASCSKAFGRLRPDVSRTVLRLTDNIVYNAMAVLNENDARELLNNVISLMKIHADILQSIQNMGDLSMDDVAADVGDMLMILTHILDEEGEVDVGEACFYGLSTVLPVMNESILDVPVVNRCFFRFIAQLVCAHAEKLTYLPADFCAKILQSIDMQRASFDASTERKALEAITALARTRVTSHQHHHFNSAKQDNYDSFQQRHSNNFINQGSTTGSLAVVDSALRQFLLRIFEAIANGSAHMSNLDAAADALLPLAYVQVDSGDGNTISAFEQVGHALVSSSGNNADLRGAVVHLGHVASEAGLAYGFRNDNSGRLSPAANRSAVLQATKQFREAVANFSNEARNCLVSVAIGTTPTS